MIRRSAFATNRSRIFAFLVLVLLLSSCSDSFTENQIIESDQLHNVTVSLTGINLSTTPYTRASDKGAAEAGVKRIALSVFDLNGVLITSAAQNKDADAENFGKPVTFRLPVGSYKFVAVAHTVAGESDPVATINSVTEFSLGAAIVGNPTYSIVKDVTISGNTTQSVTIDMGTRRNATFAVQFTDDNPSDVAKIQLIVSPASTAYTNLKVNPSTGLADSQWKYEKTFVISTLGITTVKNCGFSIPLMLTAATQTLDATINALSATGEVLYTRTLTGVTLKQSHMTKATGSFFSPGVTNAFTFDVSETTDNISLD